MSCTVAYTCDHCGEQVVIEPLAGKHPELLVRVAYPRGWSFDSDDDAMCPSCTAKDSTSAQELEASSLPPAIPQPSAQEGAQEDIA